MKRLSLSLLLAAAVVTTIGGSVAYAAPAPAQPTVAQCSDSTCSSSSSTSEGDEVAARIKVGVSASAPVRLEWVRLEARYGTSGSWTCFRQWTSADGSFSASYEWNTTKWPGSASSPPAGCAESSLYGDATSNGTYQFRTVAREAGTGSVAASSAFDTRVKNGVSTPTWASNPTVSGDTDGEPIVVLRWNASPEPDIAEYHYIRSGPQGEEQFAVNARFPGGQGCERDGDVYVCYDDYFPSSYAGNYQYALRAYRSSPSGEPCTFDSDQRCIQSGTSATRSASLRAKTVPSPSVTPTPTPTASSSGKATSRPSSSPTRRPARVRGTTDSREFYTGTYEKTLPYSDGGTVLMPTPYGDSGSGSGSGATGDQAIASRNEDDTAGDDRRLWFSIAGGLVLLLAAGHMGRLLRDH